MKLKKILLILLAIHTGLSSISPNYNHDASAQKYHLKAEHCLAEKTDHTMV